MLDLPLVLEAVEQLHRELSAVAGYTDQLAGELAAVGSPGIPSLHRAVRRAADVMRDVRDRVLDAATSEPSIAHRASAVRARSTVARMQVTDLRLAAREVPPTFWPSSGRLRSIDAVHDHLVAQLDAIEARWSSEPKAARVVGRRVQRERLRGELAAIERAERAFDDLGKDPDLACFLAAGASVTSERFRTACRALAAVLEVPLAPLTALPFARPPLAQQLASHMVTFTGCPHDTSIPPTTSEPKP